MTVAPSAQPSATAIIVGGDRPARVRVPPSYDKSRPAPLLIVLHGYGSSGSSHESYFHLQQEAERRGFVTAYPNGTPDRNGNQFWNATDACCDFERTAIDDVGYLDGVVSAIQAAVAVDPRRVYLVGHSNGGFMSYRMACAHADRIAAIVSLAGATFVEPADCRPTAPVAVLEIHGTADDTIGFSGGRLEGVGSAPMAPFPGAEKSVATWAEYDGCAATASSADQRVDVDADLMDAGQAAEATVKRWAGCKPGGAGELWTIPGGNHAPRISDAFPSAVLDFLEAHPKP